MKLKQALQQARATLQSNNIENPELTAEVLLRYAVKVNRVELYISLDNELNPEDETIFNKFLVRHLAGEPVAYITGHKEFRGLDFFVDNRVLIPRPETELLVEKVLEAAGNKDKLTIADIGTGCGAIAVSLAINLPDAKIYAIDISALALEVALENSRRLNVLDRICFLTGNLLEPLPEAVDIIAANLPYVRESEIENSHPLRFEPELSLNGGEDGLTQIRQFCSQIKSKIKPKGSIFLEIGEGQSLAVVSLLRKSVPAATINVFKDFAGIERVIRVYNR